MSNASILARLEGAVQELEERRMAAGRFRSFFVSSIEALESVPYAAIVRMRELQHRLEVSSYAGEEECAGGLSEVIQDVRRLIEELKHR